MKTSDFDYNLPEEFIAQTPVEPRSASRLLVLRRDSDELEFTHFWEIGRFLNPGDLLVLNQTRVIPARVFAQKKPGGGKVELLLLKRIDAQTWEILGGGKGLAVGRQLAVSEDMDAEVIQVLDGPRRVVRFSQPVEAVLEKIGHVPLPPYIHTPLANPERYQTVYAHQPGSAAAPTAGLHFTPELLSELEGKGIRTAQVTLHVGLDTFAPVNEDDPQEHHIHTEWCEVLPETARMINATRQNGHRIVAVGTTSVRTIESAARSAADGQAVAPFTGQTDLFILPGYRFRATDVMITNFHLPRSTLLMLVSAFAGRDRILSAYEAAKAAGFRFFSFGDAMIII